MKIPDPGKTISTTFAPTAAARPSYDDEHNQTDDGEGDGDGDGEFLYGCVRVVGVLWESFVVV
jgi:hypothetical protein